MFVDLNAELCAFKAVIVTLKDDIIRQRDAVSISSTNTGSAICLAIRSCSLGTAHDQRGGRTCVLSMSWGHARGQDNARTVLITIGRILTGQTPTKHGKRLGQGFIPFGGMTFSFEQWRMHCTAWTPRQCERWVGSAEDRTAPR